MGKKKLTFNEYFARLDIYALNVDDIAHALREAEITDSQRNVVFEQLYEAMRRKKGAEYSVEQLPSLRFRGRQILINGMEKTITDYQAPTGDDDQWRLVLDGEIYNVNNWTRFILLWEEE